MPKEICVHCGKNEVHVRRDSMRRGHHPKCSECKNKKETRYCRICEKPFITSPVSKRVLCGSKECKLANRKLNWEKQKERMRSKEEIPCPECGTMFRPIKGRTFCKRSCSAKSNMRKQQSKKRKLSPKVITERRLKKTEEYIATVKDPFEDVKMYGAGDDIYVTDFNDANFGSGLFL